MLSKQLIKNFDNTLGDDYKINWFDSSTISVTTPFKTRNGDKIVLFMDENPFSEKYLINIIDAGWTIDDYLMENTKPNTKMIDSLATQNHVNFKQNKFIETSCSDNCKDMLFAFKRLLNTVIKVDSNIEKYGVK